MNKSIIILVLVIISIGLASYLAFKSTNKLPDVDVDVADNVVNYSRYDLAGEIVTVLIEEVVPYDTLSIVIVDSSVDFKGMDVAAFTERYEFGDNNFKISINSNHTFGQLKQVLCHEMVHVEQMVRGDLDYVGGNYIWKGELVSPWSDYKEREFELEAFRRQWKLLSMLNKKLYQ